ncbi:MAG: hypothetical protein HY236_08005, partial [Acidobacteria bacterium]|nr:hypothetical protein [Acidobacteriota bacterium]
MSKPIAAGARLLLLLAVAWAAPAQDRLRNVTVNTETDEGKLLQQAGEENDSAKKIALLEQFLQKYGSHDGVPSVHYQLLNECLKANSFDKALDHGEQAQAVAPEDIEVAHLLVKAAEGKGAAPRLAAAV